MRFIPSTVCPYDSVAHARALLEERGINHLPVLSNGRLVGIVSSRDLEPGKRSARPVMIKRALETHPNRVAVASVMTENVYTAEANNTLTEAAELMSRRHISALPIVERGHLESMLRRRDILSCPFKRSADASLSRQPTGHTGALYVSHRIEGRG